MEEQSGGVNEQPMENLRIVLKGIEQDASPSVYIVSEGESYGPNAHFSVNLQGESASEAENALMRQFESNRESQASQSVDSVQSSTRVSKHPPTASSSTIKQGNSAECVFLSSCIVRLVLLVKLDNKCDALTPSVVSSALSLNFELAPQTTV